MNELLQKSILLVEDDDEVYELIRGPIEQLGFQVVRAADGLTGLQLAQDPAVVLVVLDVNLPKLSGVEICKRLRTAGNDVPIIMLTAQGTEIDRVLGLELGADDYVAKPFSLRELIARINARLRRHGSTRSPESELVFGDLKVDRLGHHVWLGRQEIQLTPIEFDLLLALAESPGRALSKEQLLATVWGGGTIDDEKTVTMNIARLRQKLGEGPKQARFIETIRGIGYRFIGHETGEPPESSG